MDKRMRDDLDRYITGNYGEDSIGPDDDTEDDVEVVDKSISLDATLLNLKK